MFTIRFGDFNREKRSSSELCARVITMLEPADAKPRCLVVAISGNMAPKPIKFPTTWIYWRRTSTIILCAYTWAERFQSWMPLTSVSSSAIYWVRGHPTGTVVWEIRSLAVMPTKPGCRPPVRRATPYAYWKLNLGNSEAIAAVPCDNAHTSSARCTNGVRRIRRIQYVTGLFTNRKRIIQTCQPEFIRRTKRRAL